MLETSRVVQDFDESRAATLGPTEAFAFLTGEGSSRIFPAKRLRAQALRERYRTRIETEGATQAGEYDLAGTHVFVASNSGKTAEAVRLLRSLRTADEGRKPRALTAVVAHAGGPISAETDETFVLGCGNEDAVAATKSVVEQALFYDVAFRAVEGRSFPNRDALSSAIEETLTAALPDEVVAALSGRDLAGGDGRGGAPSGGGTIYFAGRNDGVAEELALKTNEITRRPSGYLEGTFAVHGIEEVMTANDLVVVVEPFPEEEAKFDTVLRQGVGLSVVAISSRPTRFPTLRVSHLEDGQPYVDLCAGWNLLVELGLAAGIDLDKPERARKVGNEFVGS